jgi:uncharacterized membrane protein
MFSRKINLFEKILLPVAVTVTVFGFYLLVQADKVSEIEGWVKLSAIFVWLLLVFVMIIAATIEDVKEELVMLSREHVAEIKLLKEIVHEQLLEMKYLRKDLVEKPKEKIEKKSHP